MNVGHFPPPKRRGLLIHGGLILALAVISIIGFVNLTRAPVGPAFLTDLLIGLFAVAPIPYLIYRAYALVRADYHLDRDSLGLNWGLRVENIPLNDIEWIRSASDLSYPLSLPAFRLPGGVLGLRRHPDLGLVEFIAADSRNLLIVATAKRVFVISPQDPSGLSQAFARSTEMGSLIPSKAKSVYPSFVITQAWEHNAVRYFWLSSLFLNIGLFVWVSLLIPRLAQITLNLQNSQGPIEAVPSTQLILLPLASTFLAAGGWLAGLYFFRWEKERALAFIVWATGALTSLAFIIAVFFIINTPV
ncbi:MAG TPA: PH domain-containing protein [Anaerolineales bacterium]|jgi:hypothetical protein